MLTNPQIPDPIDLGHFPLPAKREGYRDGHQVGRGQE